MTNIMVICSERMKKLLPKLIFKIHGNRSTFSDKWFDEVKNDLIRVVLMWQNILDRTKYSLEI